MKLNGTVLNGRVIFRDNVPGIVVIINLKSQAPNIKEIPNSNIQCPKQVCLLEFRLLWFICYLSFAIWNFSPKLKSFYSDQTGRFSGQRQGWTLNPKPGTVCALDCVAQGDRYISKITPHWACEPNSIFVKKAHHLSTSILISWDLTRSLWLMTNAIFETNYSLQLAVGSPRIFSP